MGNIKVEISTCLKSSLKPTINSFEIAILQQLQEPTYPTALARKLGDSPQKVHYYIRKLEKLGLIKPQHPNAYPHVYALTPQGRWLLWEFQKRLTGGGDGVWGGLRLHRVVLKFPIVRGSPTCGGRGVGRVVRMRNWERRVWRESGYTVELTSKHVIVYVDLPPSSDSPENLLVLAVSIGERVAQRVAQRVGIEELGFAKLATKPHFAVLGDPVSHAVAQKMQVSTPNGRIDQSVEKGELEFFNIKSVVDYLSMPSRLREVERQVQVLTKGQVTILQVLNQIENGLVLLISSVRELTQALKEREVRGSGG